MRAWTACLACACGWLLMLLPLPSALAQPLIAAPPPEPGQPDPLAAFMVPQPPIDPRQPIQVTVEFDPPIIAAGQPAVYRLSLTVLEQSVEWPENVPFPREWMVRRGARGQFLQSLGANVVPRNTFLFHVRPDAPGRFTVPAYSIQARGETVSVPAATLEVLPAGTPGLEPAPRLLLAAPAGDVYTGQSVDLEVLLPGRPAGTVQTLAQTQINGEGFIVDRSFTPQRVETRVIGGQSIPTFVHQALVTPLRAGEIEMSAQGYTFGGRTPGGMVIMGSGGQITLPGGQPVYTLVDSEPLLLNVRPLPEAGRPDSFNGAIGSFLVDSPVLSTNRLRAGDLLSMVVVVRGRGNLDRLTPPPVPVSPQWQVLPARREQAMPAVIRQRGFVALEYRLVPLDPGITATPVIPFSAFDPVAGAYADLTIPAVPLKVEPGSAGTAPVGTGSLTEARSLLMSAARRDTPPERLGADAATPGRFSSGLAPVHASAGFLALQVVPAALLAGAWFWDRRRRFLEEHPEVLIRRKARRAVARHQKLARRAVRRGDGEAFLSSALAGLREACAPMKPAHAEALVGCDVLPELAAYSDETRELARRLFALANTTRFGGGPLASKELLGLAPQVDTTLEGLRKKL